MLVDPYPMPERLFTNKVRWAIPLSLRIRHGIVSVSTPGLAAREPFQSHPAAANHAVRFSRLQKISRTSGLEPATQSRAAEPGKQRRDRPLIGANEKPDEEEHQGAKIEARFARRNHSSRSSG